MIPTMSTGPLPSTFNPTYSGGFTQFLQTTPLGLTPSRILTPVVAAQALLTSLFENVPLMGTPSSAITMDPLPSQQADTTLTTLPPSQPMSPTVDSPI